MKSLNIIANVSKDGALGKAGELIWRIPEDQRFFKNTTLGSVVVMGRKTFASIGKPLPERRNVILSSHRQDIPGLEWCTSGDELKHLLAETPEDVFIIGGASLYQMFLNQADKLYLTEVDATKPADTFFPEFDKSQFTRQVLQTGEYEGVKYQIVKYTRRVTNHS